MKRLATAIALLALASCVPPWQGTPIDPASPGWVWLAEVADLAVDWRADPALPSIDTPRCERALADLEVRTATEVEWIGDLRLCPRMPDGCSTRCGRGVTTCATGTVTWASGSPVIYLSPGESADGHGVTVRHEVAHVLSGCVGRGVDAWHTHADVWGPQGVVWRRSER